MGKMLSHELPVAYTGIRVEFGRAPVRLNRNESGFLAILGVNGTESVTSIGAFVLFVAPAPRNRSERSPTIALLRVARLLPRNADEAL